MSDEAKLGGGDVIINLDGEEKVLKPSLLAAQTISRQTGGLLGAIERIVKLDLDTIYTVITVGLGYGGARKPPQDLAEKIWRSGLPDDTPGALIERCVLYIRVLANGGRMPNPEQSQGEPLNPP